LSEDFFDDSNNDVKTEAYDIFARKMESSVWANLQMGNSSVKKRSCYSQPVNSVGFMGDKGVFMTASGKTLEGSGIERLYYTATTHPGFSGAPIFAGDSVVAMHTGSQGDKNTGLRIEIIQFLLREKNESSADWNRDRVKFDFKFKGRSSKAKQLADSEIWGLEDDDGYVELDLSYDDIKDIMREKDNPAYATMIDALTDPDTSPLTSRKLHYAQYYLNEANLIEKIVDALKKEQGPEEERKESAPVVTGVNPRAETSAETRSDYLDRGMLIRGKKESVHARSKPERNPEVTELIEKHGAGKLGYDPLAFDMPDMDRTTEQISLENHLELYENIRKAA
jgi:hypothetical protein